MHDLIVSAKRAAQPAGLASAETPFGCAWVGAGALRGRGQSSLSLQGSTGQILARLDGPALVGQFTLAMAITAPIVVFSQLQLREAQAVDAGSRCPFADYRAVRLYTAALTLIVIFIVAAFTGYPVAVAAVICSVGLTRSIERLSDIYYGLAQRHGYRTPAQVHVEQLSTLAAARRRHCSVSNLWTDTAPWSRCLGRGCDLHALALQAIPAADWGAVRAGRSGTVDPTRRSGRSLSMTSK
jgi:hypothetical protein